MMSAEHVALVEGILQSAWPALGSEMVDGWLVRTSKGYTKRANSVTPLYQGFLGQDARIDYCESRLSANGLPSIFKLTAVHGELDIELGLRGYEKIEQSLVMALPLHEKPGGRGYLPDPDAELHMWLTEEWLSAFCRFNKVSPNQREIAGEMLSRMPFAAAFTLLKKGRQIMAVGLAVQILNHVVLFDIASHPDHRREGYGRRLLTTLLAWGHGVNANAALLQVVSTNTAALALYKEFEFVEQYRYWYRRSDAPLKAHRARLRSTTAKYKRD